MSGYIIQDQWAGQNSPVWVCAPPGWMRCKDGTIERDGSLSGGPEWTYNRGDAFVFKTHRAAARVRNRTASGVIVEVKDD